MVGQGDILGAGRGFVVDVWVSGWVSRGQAGAMGRPSELGDDYSRTFLAHGGMQGCVQALRIKQKGSGSGVRLLLLLLLGPLATEALWTRLALCAGQQALDLGHDVGVAQLLQAVQHARRGALGAALHPQRQELVRAVQQLVGAMGVTAWWVGPGGEEREGGRGVQRRSWVDGDGDGGCGTLQQMVSAVVVPRRR